jgi:hypothetical protein
MRLAGQGDGRDRARIFLIACRLVGRRPWFSEKRHKGAAFSQRAGSFCLMS